ncbi:hypothetical protein BDF22DRAFT_700712 [Syncephalis plumigaleata]|nr:hypothetical protein BDF22DRAFT_700712 [Syncephalis plumigaleata]
MAFPLLARNIQPRVGVRAWTQSIQMPLLRGLRSKSEISVELRETIPDIGKSGEVVKVRAGYMRNYLFRYGKAKYVSRERPILCFAERQAIEAEKKAQEQQAQGLLQEQTDIAMAGQDRAAQMLRDRLEQLRRLPPLQFARRARGAPPSTTDVPDRRAIFGSVSVDDVLLRLREMHQLVVERSWIQLVSSSADDHGSSSDRIRQLGGARFQVNIPGVGTSTLRVMVTPEETTETEATKHQQNKEETTTHAN